MVFDWGEYPLQEYDPYAEYSCKFPLKFSAWRYEKGHVVAPATVAIDSQRWINQITSDVNWRLRKAGNDFTVFDKAALASSNIDEQEAAMNAKEGNAMFIDTNGLGVGNIVHKVDNSPGRGVAEMMGMLPVVKGFAESSMGIYEGNFGAPQGPDQLVGTMKLQLQQAGVQQQPFYAAIAHLYEQMHQFDAQAGKQWYCRQPWILEQMVGQEYAAAMTLTQDAQLESFRVKVELVPDGAQQRIMVDQQIVPGLMQLGLLDPETAAFVLGRSSVDEVYAEARAYTQRAAKAAEQQAQAQQQQQQEAAMGMRQQQLEQQQDEIHQDQTKAELENKKLDIKQQAPYNQAKSEWLKPPELEQTPNETTLTP